MLQVKAKFVSIPQNAGDLAMHTKHNELYHIHLVSYPDLFYFKLTVTIEIIQTTAPLLLNGPDIERYWSNV